MESLIMLVALMMGIAMYFIPSMIAFARSHHNKVAIFAVNFLLGVTVLGWIVALVWSLTAKREAAAVPAS